MRVEVTLDRTLQWIALQYAVVWKEPVADVVETAIAEFLKRRPAIPSTETTRGDQSIGSDAKNDRASVLISPGLYKSASDYAASVGIGIDRLIDMSVDTFCRERID